MSCCPPNAEKYLAPDYTFVGKITTLSETVEFYETGSSSSKNAVIVIPDIFGWNGGRTRNIADYLADQGYYTVVPKLLSPPIGGGTDGDGFAAFSFDTFLADIVKFPFEGHLQPILRAVTAHLKSSGVEKIALLGFCWGGWTGCHLLVNEEDAKEYTCLAIGHPSVHLEQYAWQKDIQALFDRVQKPLLMLPAKGDPDGYREQGSYHLSVQARFPTSRTVDFPEEEHGFIPRGDISKPATKASVDKALDEIVTFLAAHF